MNLLYFAALGISKGSLETWKSFHLHFLFFENYKITFIDTSVYFLNFYRYQCLAIERWTIPKDLK